MHACTTRPTRSTRYSQCWISIVLLSIPPGYITSRLPPIIQIHVLLLADQLQPQIPHSRLMVLRQVLDHFAFVVHARAGRVPGHFSIEWLIVLCRLLAILNAVELSVAYCEERQSESENRTTLTSTSYRCKTRSSADRASGSEPPSRVLTWA